MSVTLGYATTQQKRRFHCDACGYRCKAIVQGIGEGSQSFLNEEGTVERRAQENAEKDAERTFDIVACPKCGARDAPAVRRWWLAHVGPLLAIFVVIAAMGWIPLIFEINMRPQDRIIAGWLTTGIGFLVCGITLLVSVIPKWRSAPQRVQFEDSSST